MDSSGFEPDFTWEKFFFCLASHAIIVIGILLFASIKKYDFALAGFLTMITSLLYHIIQFGSILGHQHLVLLHIGDLTMIFVTFNVVIYSFYRLSIWKRYLLMMFNFPFAYILGVLAYSSYAIVVLIFAEFVFLLWLHHHHNMKHNHGVLLFDSFNCIMLAIIVGFVGTAFFFFYWGGNPGEINYSYRHSIWHFFVFGAYDVIAVICWHMYNKTMELIREMEKDYGRLSPAILRALLNGDEVKVDSHFLKKYPVLLEHTKESIKLRVGIALGLISKKEFADYEKAENERKAKKEEQVKPALVQQILSKDDEAQQDEEDEQGEDDDELEPVDEEEDQENEDEEIDYDDLI